jgi:hypothetical protein
MSTLEMPPQVRGRIACTDSRSTWFSVRHLYDANPVADAIDPFFGEPIPGAASDSGAARSRGDKCTIVTFSTFYAWLFAVCG